MKATREEVYQAIDEERDYQDALWSEELTEGKHLTGEFLLYIDEYVCRAKHDITQVAEPKGADLALHGIRKIAGLCVACMEQNGVLYRDMRDLNTQRYREHGIAREKPSGFVDPSSVPDSTAFSKEVSRVDRDGPISQHASTPRVSDEEEKFDLPPTGAHKVSLDQRRSRSGTPVGAGSEIDAMRRRAREAELKEPPC